MSLVALIEWVDVKSSSSYVLSKLFPLSSHVGSINYAEFLWDEMSSFILFSSIFSLLIIILDSVSVYVYKLMSVLNEILAWKLIWGRFSLPITLSLLYVFRLFYSILLTCELPLVHLLSLDLYATLLLWFLLYHKKSWIFILLL